LHVSMLGLFCDFSTIRRLPNVVMMSISRDSIKSAFALGIKTQQILRFLEKHAHPKLREGTASPLPQNVVDQIFLWDQEQHRVKWDEVYVHKATMDGEFEFIVQLAKQRGLYAYSNNNKRVIMIKHNGAKFMEKKITDWRARKAAGM
jgi:transcription initiation factor TFIIH subunit 4